jgi:dipeptidyl aminopeptidase/acylaminoacyl peptidase
VTRLFLGKTFAQAPDLYREASPINHVDKNDPPVLLIHGSLDSIVPSENSDLLAEKLRAVGVPVTYDKIKGWSHVMDFFSPITERTLWHCYQFLKTHAPSDELSKQR